MALIFGARVACAGTPDVDARVLVGETQDVSARVHAPHYAAGYRADAAGERAFASARDIGPLRAFDAGNIALRAGERLVLGRTLGAYGTGSVAPSVPLSATGTLSSWFGRPGAALTLGAAGWLVTAAVLEAHEGRRRTAWAGIARVFAGHHIGAVIGAPVAPGYRRHITASLFGSSTLAPVVVSYEAMRAADRRLFFAVRASGRTDARVAAMIYHAPVFASDVAPAVHPFPRPGYAHRGGRLEVSVSRNRASARARISAGVRHTPESRDHLRRVDLSVRAPIARTTRWQGDVVWWQKDERDAPSSILLQDLEQAREGFVRLSTLIEARQSRAIHHAVRFHYWPSPHGADGSVASVATALRNRVAEVEWRVSTFALPVGRLGYIGRPGVGTREYFSAVSGNGVDLSARLRVSWRGARLVAYAGKPWARDARYYLGVEVP